MELRDGGNWLSVTCDFVGSPYPIYRGDRRLEVSVSSDGFAGGASGVWVDAVGLGRFIEQLTALEATRRGAARLESMDDPEAFWLEFRATDGIGHMAVSGRVMRGRQSLDFEFPFCPSLLLSMVAKFGAIAEAEA